MIISECVHANRVSPKYSYTDEYIDFVLEEILYNVKVGSDQDIMSLVPKYLDFDNIKSTVLKKKFIELYGEKDKGKYYLTESIKTKIEEYYSIKSDISDIYNLESFIISSSINLNADCYEKFYSSVIMYLVLKAKVNNYSLKETSIYIYNYLKHYNKNIKILIDNLNKIKKTYYSLSIYQIFTFDNIDKNLMIKNNINTVEELCKINPNALLVLFSHDFGYSINILNSLSINIKTVVDDIFKDIEEKNLEILIKRNGYLNKSKMTLEEIGSEWNVTRERIRQLESKTSKKIKTLAAENINILLSFYNSELGKRKPYITLDKLKNKYEESFLLKILLLFNYGDTNLTYDNNFQIIYDKEVNNIDIMIEDVVNKLGIVAEPSELEKADLFTQNVICNNYKKITDELYLKKGCMYRDIFLDLLEELFPKGYKAGSDDDYNIFIDAVKNRYKIENDLPSKHSLEAMIGRGNFIQSDRGEYVPGKYAIKIEQEMLDKILSYIGENEFTYYNAIYDKFSSYLKKIGITNRYYLKGCLDKYLPEDMTTKRDYILCGDSQKTPYDIVLNQMHSYEGKFSKADLKKAFAGMKDYTVYNYLYNEIDNGLIWISSNEFIYVDKYNMGDDVKIELKKFIDDLFNSLDTKLLTSKKIYAKLQLTNKSLFEKLNLTNGHFELFSVIKAIYSSYFYSRPYVFLEESAYNTRSTIIQNYVRQFDSFNFKMIQDYQSKMNIGTLYSYLEFMENMSEEYVQVDIDEMVKIEKLNLNSIMLNDIRKTIDLILDNFDLIDTSKFNGYSLLPKISYVWNKYLLIGIIRTYFSDYYEIKNTENMYNNTEFEVRRVKYE